MSAQHGTAANRTERRKAQTRQKLIDAARGMLADGTAQKASIEAITERADVGFGSFYNHFTSKDELYAAAVTDVLVLVGAALDDLHRDLGDPVAAYALSVRLSVRGALLRPQFAQILVSNGMSYLDDAQGPAAYIQRDIEAAAATGRLRVDNAPLAVAVTLGSVLASLRLALADPDLAVGSVAEQLAEHLLRMFGLPADEAHAVANAPLPS
ncbi:TetR/AcrR family transcriptional regulator [Winogradskya humida]|uniref:TetR-family transcriptional regulator n=1 Tax=Winogradskya humida TaxID=113566 RepID=A0ABQ4A6H5_9ACTN|nr:TetR/AcrR family transcriptional regulator [Actinoplanes humidus]GIE26448.1 putative TetR-family transcriptional regulator [Actinoplanes humidus]